MKKSLKFTLCIIVVIFFTIFLYKKYYLENDNIVKIPPKSTFTQRLVKPAEKPKQTIKVGLVDNGKIAQNQAINKPTSTTGSIIEDVINEERYVPFNEISDITGYDTKNLDSALTDGGRYFTIEDMKPFLESKVGDTFSIVLDGYEFKGKVVSADKHIFDEKADLIAHGGVVDENKTYKSGYSTGYRISLSKDDIVKYISFTSGSNGEFLGEIEYQDISGYGYKFQYNNGIGVFMTMSDYRKSWGEKYELEEDIEWLMRYK